MNALQKPLYKKILQNNYTTQKNKSNSFKTVARDKFVYLFSKYLFASSAEISFIVSPQHLMPQFSQVQSIKTLTIAPHFSQRTILSMPTPPLLIKSLKQANKLVNCI